MFMLESGNTATIDQVRAVQTPRASSTWKPVSHRDVLDRVFKEASDRGLEYDFDALLRDGKLHNDGESIPVPGAHCYFKMLFHPCPDLRAPAGTSYTLVGINTHDKTQALAFVSGAEVSVCSNGMRIGDIIVKRKHTNGLNLGDHVHEVFNQFMDGQGMAHQMVNGLREQRLTDQRAINMIVDAADAGAIPSRNILPVVNEWRKPRHEEFQPRTGWSLYNAHTEIMKRQSPSRQRDGFRALNEVFAPTIGVSSN
jgi:hypothetical protein